MVYLKGCPLSCAWCHNPEGLAPRPETAYDGRKCIHCRRCVELCPNGCISPAGDTLVIDRSRCEGCLRCVENCPSGAMTGYGRTMTVEQTLEQILKDQAYFRATGGGVTVSGGECLLYPAFVAQLLRRCRELGVHTLVESAFHVPYSAIQTVAPYTDQFYVDIKHMDPQIHRQYTGQSNRRILENLEALSRDGGRILPRIPVIPGVNDSRENLLATADFGRSLGAENIMLLKYNALASGKYRMLGKSFRDFSRDAVDIPTLCQTLNQALGKEGFFICT